MNQKKMLISTLFIAAMLLNLAVMPVMAKPNTITVTVMSSTKNSLLGYGVHILLGESVYADLRIEKDGSRARVTWTVPASAYNGQQWKIRVYRPDGLLLAQDYVYLSIKLGASIKINVNN